MFDLSNDDLITLRAGDPVIKKYYSVCPRTEVYSGRLASFYTDDVTNGMYGFVVSDGVGDLADIEVDMTMDIGTTPGGHDIGSFRIRKAPTTEPTTIWVNETMLGEVAAAFNHYLTVRDEYRIWQRRPRLVGTMTGGATYVNSFVSYRDYDVTHTDQNRYIEPKANIVQEKVDADHYISAKPSGWLDKGEIFRTVKLDSRTSVGMAYGAGTLTYQWYVKDGTISVGTDTDEQIEVQFPEGFRNIKLEVTDALGTVGIIHMPIWAHGPNYLPMTAFNITKDERKDGREMSFEFYGDSDLTPGLVMKTMGCYWEQIVYPSEVRQYVDQFVGWIVSDNASLRKGRLDKYTIDMGGVQRFLSQMDGFGLTVVKSSAEPILWWECRHITTMRVIYNYILRWYTTAMSICNFFPTDYPDEMGGEEIKKSQIWDQLVELMKTKSGSIGCDSLNGIWCWTHPSYPDLADRDYSMVMTLESQEWKDEDGLTITSDGLQKIGMVKGSGSTWDGDVSSIFYAIAPAKGGSAAGGSDDFPFQRLTNAGGLTEIRRLVMYHYYRVNNPRGPVSITLIRPMDVFEPGRGDMVNLTYNEQNLSGKQLVVVPFLVTGVTVNHSSEQGQPSKALSLTLEEITNAPEGFFGDEDEQVVDNNTPGQLPDPNTGLDLPILPEILFPDSNYYPPPLQPPSPYDDTAVPPIPDSGLNGNTVMILTRKGRVHFTQNFKTTLTSVAVEPTFDAGEKPAAIKFGKRNISTDAIDAMILSSKGSACQSRLWHCPDLTAVTPVWSDGAWINGMYDQIGKVDDTGKVHIYDPGVSMMWSKTFDFTISAQGWTVPNTSDPYLPRGHYSPGIGFGSDHWETFISPVAGRILSPTFDSRTIIQIRVWYTYGETAGGNQNIKTYVGASDFNEETIARGSGDSGTSSVDFPGSAYGSSIGVRYSQQNAAGYDDPEFELPVITKVQVVGLGTSPFTSPDPAPEFHTSMNVATVGGTGWTFGTSVGIYFPAGAQVEIEFGDEVASYNAIDGDFDADGNIVEDSIFYGTPLAGSNRGRICYRFMKAEDEAIYSRFGAWKPCGKGPTTVNAERSGFLFFVIDDELDFGDNVGVLSITLRPIARAAKDAYTTTWGEDYATTHTVGDGTPSQGGFDLRGSLAIACNGKQMMKSISNAAYANWGAPIAYDDRTPYYLHYPRKRLDSSYTNSLSNPQFIAVATTIYVDASNPTMWKGVPNTAGTVITLTSITPKLTDGIDYYFRPVNARHCVTSCESNGRKLYAIGYANGYGGAAYLWKSTDGGTTWTIVGAHIGAGGSGFITTRESDVNGLELYYSGGSNGYPYYSEDAGVTRTERIFPSLAFDVDDYYVLQIEVLP